MDFTEISLIHHVGIVLFFLWLLSHLNCCPAVVYVVSLIYLLMVHERYFMRLRKKLQYEEKRQSSQKRVLSDSETVRWLNHAVENIWPICMEQIASQMVLLPIIPWFLEKYKPWTAKKAVVQHLYLGRNPPMFTEMRVLRQCSDDDHLVLELGMNFLTADDMSAILAVKLRKRLGFGMWAKLHVTGMHIEGKVLVGVKFLRQWPFLGRLRVCFAEPPYFQMTVKPIFTHGLDVTELPGIAGWLDKLLSVAFEQTLVEPNMLVVDIEKFASCQPEMIPLFDYPESHCMLCFANYFENWFFIDEKEAIAYVKVEVIEASDMKRSELNGLADPYVKGQLGPYRFKTKTQKKTLAPKWLEEFRIPICTWESSNLLSIEVRDKDHFVDDSLGKCAINISELRGGKRHELWLALQNIKTGRLHLAVTVLEDISKEKVSAQNVETLKKEDIKHSCVGETADKNQVPSASFDESSKVPDNFEPINIEGQEKAGIWIHQPGSEATQTWEPRKGKSRFLETKICREPKKSFERTPSAVSGSLTNDSSSSDENPDEKNPGYRVRKRFNKIFRRSPKRDDHSGNLATVQSQYANLKAVDAKDVALKVVLDDNPSGPLSGKDDSHSGPLSGKVSKEGSMSPESSSPDSPDKNMRGMAKSFWKHAGKSARSLKHVLSLKGSRKSRSDASEIAERVNAAESESSNDESLSSSIGAEGIPVVSHSMSFPSNDDSNHVLHRKSGSETDHFNDLIGKYNVEGLKETDDAKISNSGKLR